MTLLWLGNRKYTPGKSVVLRQLRLFHEISGLFFLSLFLLFVGGLLILGSLLCLKVHWLLVIGVFLLALLAPCQLMGIHHLAAPFTRL
jgi:hypothetical protein